MTHFDILEARYKNDPWHQFKGKLKNYDITRQIFHNLCHDLEHNYISKKDYDDKIFLIKSKIKQEIQDYTNLLEAINRK